MAEKKQTYAEIVAERDAYKHELDVMKQNRVNRQAKNSVFLNLFMRKEYQLQLYKELFPQDTTITEDDLELVTLDNVLAIHPYNDLGLLPYMGIAEEQIKAGIIKRYDLTPTYAQNFLDDDSDSDDSRPWAL